MFKIDRTDYGIRLTFGGKIDAEEMTRWYNEFKSVVNEHAPGFCVFVDMRTLIPITSDARPPLTAGQKYAKSNGMARSVVVLSNPVLTLQFKDIAHQTGIYKWERYIDASHERNWEQIGLDWLIKSEDPDKKEKLIQE